MKALPEWFSPPEDIERKSKIHREYSFIAAYDNEKAVGFAAIKTLDESAVYEPYNGTRAFYKKEGFYPLEVFTCVWDEENPCLFMVKVIDTTVHSACASCEACVPLPPVKPA